jgi:hypothetical protein
MSNKDYYVRVNNEVVTFPKLPVVVKLASGADQQRTRLE